jgi:hypothetical protein
MLLSFHRFIVTKTKMDLRLHSLEPADFNRAEGDELDEEEEDKRSSEIVPPLFQVIC